MELWLNNFVFPGLNYHVIVLLGPLFFYFSSFIAYEEISLALISLSKSNSQCNLGGKLVGRIFESEGEDIYGNYVT